MKHMNNLKFIEATNKGHPRPAQPALTVSAPIPLSRETSAVADPALTVSALILAAPGGSMEPDTVGGERKQK
jgi:hypothetical protein